MASFLESRTARATAALAVASVASVASVVAALAGCGAGPEPTPQATAPTTATTTASTAPAARPNPSGPRAPSPTPSPIRAAPRVTPVTAAELGASWRPECPLGPDRLRRVELDHLGFDGRTHRGALVVHEELVDRVIEIFDHLYRIGYPIEKMRTVDAYPGAEDELSMADNNTSAFNCRGIPGSQSWSYHAYGRAIDVNPLLNPYIGRTGAVEPANAGPYVDRNRTDPGLLHPGDPAVLAFTDRGWGWGGVWRSVRDYQHFELP